MQINCRERFTCLTQLVEHVKFKKVSREGEGSLIKKIVYCIVTNYLIFLSSLDRVYFVNEASLRIFLSSLDCVYFFLNETVL